MENIKNNINWNKIALYLKIGIIGAIIILIGDMLMGWGVKDPNKEGIENALSLYLTMSDRRMFLGALLGFTGVPLACIGHFAIYKLLRPYSSKYAKLYLIGILIFLAFGGAGVHVSSIEASFFYKYMNLTNSSLVLPSTIKFVLYFLLPLYLILISSWLVMVYAHFKAVYKNLSPYPKWSIIFSMLVGTLLFSLIGLLGQNEFINAIMVGAFSLGNIYYLALHLCYLPKAKLNYEKNFK